MTRCYVSLSGLELWGLPSVRIRSVCVFFQAEDGIRDLVRSRGFGDVYKRQAPGRAGEELHGRAVQRRALPAQPRRALHGAAEPLSLIHI